MDSCHESLSLTLNPWLGVGDSKMNSGSHGKKERQRKLFFPAGPAELPLMFNEQKIM